MNWKKNTHPVIEPNFMKLNYFPLFHDFLKRKHFKYRKVYKFNFMIFEWFFFSIQLQTLFLSKNTKTDIITKTKKDIRDKKYFSTLKQLESTVMRCFFIILSIVWLRKQLFFMFKQMHKLLTYNTIIFSFIFWLFSLTLCCIPFYIR